MVDVKKNGYTLSIYEDGTGAPWTWSELGEHLGHVLTWSRRWSIGDNHDYASPRDFFEEEDANIAAWITVYAYEHSAIALSAAPFNDPWDSGAVGVCYCTEEDARRIFGNEIPSADVLRQRLAQEVDELSSFINAVYYGYHITDPEGDCVDSICGFELTDGLAELVDRMMEHCAAQFSALFEKWKEANIK